MPLIGRRPEPGDLIEFYRVGYQHWGIYVGNGYVVHLTDQEGWSSFASAFGATAVVRRDTLEHVAAGCDFRVNNKYDRKSDPYPPGKIVKAALRKVGKNMDYSLASANCEHFATNLRYGDCFSDQVDNAKTYAIGGVAAFGVLAVIATVASRANRQKQ